MQDATLILALKKFELERDRLLMAKQPLEQQREAMRAEIAKIDAKLAADHGVPAKNPIEAMRIREMLAQAEMRCEQQKHLILEQIRELETAKIDPIDVALVEVQTRKRAVEKLMERRNEQRKRMALKNEQNLQDENAASRYLRR